ncbi:MAG: hypothetical protein JW733_05290 [Coriobacteriia bacterium]|nr:hypothetical protein [Coriobacteriia bacterium]MBN2839578.1 hypothetical protein [Coriobacteriia bacterium]
MPSIYYASGVVITACVAFLVVGTVYRWDLTSPGYGRWTRIVGALALIGIALAAVWERLDEPMVAFAAVVAGGAFAAAFVWAHRQLSRRLRATLGSAGVDGARGDDTDGA